MPAYRILGRSKFEGYVTARQEGDQDIQHIAAIADEKTRHLRSTYSEDAAASRTSENLAKIPYLRGNELELLLDGEATFGSILEGIAKAESKVLVLS